MAIEKCGKIMQKSSLKGNPCKQNAYIGHERVKKQVNLVGSH